MAAKRMPIGIDDFEGIIEESFYYVDKTGLIKELLGNLDRVNLFTRPRRFGKSLNMSMLKYFFKIGTNKGLFDGLKISAETELCEEYMGQYPVISMSLKQVGGLTFEDAKRNLWVSISNSADKYGLLTESDKISERDKETFRNLCMRRGNIEASLKQLSEMLCAHYGKKVIILIDEYDAPLQWAYENGYYDDMVKLLRRFFGCAFESNDSLFFAVLTGCICVAKESIFSDLNNLKIHPISDTQFDKRFGFTDEEVRQMLTEHGFEEYYGLTEEWYNGYLFGQQHLYCPWDIVNWCDQLRTTSVRVPGNYWVSSGGTYIIRDLAEVADSVMRDEIGDLIAGKAVRKFLTSELTYRDMMGKPENIWNVLYTAGYLTARRSYGDGSVDLCIPNREVQKMFVTKVNEWFMEKVRGDEESKTRFFSAFAAGDAAAMEYCLNYLLDKCISCFGSIEQETFYHEFLRGMFGSVKWWEIRLNREVGNGRADVLAYNYRTDQAYIIKVKYSEAETNLEADAKKALEQINTQLYDEYFETRRIESIKHYGIAFYKKLCRVLNE